MESSETPTRSYILSFEENEDIKRSQKKYREAHREKVVEEAVANIL
jgi:Ethanolamine utilization protein EutJ (predicted chaperonin)